MFPQALSWPSEDKQTVVIIEKQIILQLHAMYTDNGSVK